MKSDITLTISEAARQFGVLDESIRLKLQERGEKTERGKRYTLRVLYRALHDDGQIARNERTKEEVEKLRLHNEEKRRNLISRDEVCQFITATFAPVREQVLAMPAVLAGKVNPSDPEHARAHLETWRDLFLRQCKEKLP